MAAARIKPDPKRFFLKELRVATQSFNASKHMGGLDTAYKGSLRISLGFPPDLSEVAVERLLQYARQGAREFMAEMNIISQLRHHNLVHLLGWCDKGDELILVYAYMPNGDLDDLIFGGYMNLRGFINVVVEMPAKHLVWGGKSVGIAA